MWFKVSEGLRARCTELETWFLATFTPAANPFVVAGRERRSELELKPNTVAESWERAVEKNAGTVTILSSIRLYENCTRAVWVSPA